MIIAAILISYSTLWVLGLADNIRGPLFSNLQTEFHLSSAQASIFFATSSTAALMTGLLAPHILKKLSHKQTIQLALLLLSCGLFGISYSANYSWVLLSAAIFGSSFGFLGVCQNALVAAGTRSENRKRWMSGLHLMYAGASFVAPTFVALAVDRGWIWREIFQLVGAIPLFFIFIVEMLKIPDFRFERPFDQDIERDYKKNNLSAEKIKSPSSKLILIAAVGFALYVVAEILISTRLALYYSSEIKESISNASWRVSQFFLFMLTGRLLFTLFQFPFALIYQLILSLVLSSLCLFLGLSFEPSFLALSGLFMAPFYGLAMTYITEIFSDRRDQAIAATVSMQSFFVVFMHFGVGVLTDFLTLKKALWLGPMSLTLCGLLIGYVHVKIKRN